MGITKAHTSLDMYKAWWLTVSESRLAMVSIDLTNLDLFTEGKAEAAFATLRQDEPVYWNPSANGEGFWALTKYEDVAWAWRHPTLLTSEYGNMLRLQGHKDPAAGKMMVVTDPPRHTRLRMLLNQGFTPQSVAAMEPHIYSFACELLDVLDSHTELDFVSEIAAKLPVSVTCELLGIPRMDWARIAELSASSFAAEDPEYWRGASVEQTLASANMEILWYFIELIGARRRLPAQDLVSRLIALRVDGDKRLTDEEIALNCFSFLLGGNETTRYASVGGLLMLIQDTEKLTHLREQPGLILSAVEEILRWTTPNAHVLRVATQDIERRGCKILAGQSVTLWSASANRDEDVFANPYEFDVERSPNRHLTFGIGNHYCIGANLARLELRVLFQEIVRRGYGFEIVSEPVRLRSNFLAGYKHLRVRLL